MKPIPFVIVILLYFLTTNCKPDKEWGYGPNRALKMSFTDTNYIFNRYDRDEISFGYYADSLIYYFDESGRKVFKDYVIISTRLDDEPYYILSIGGIAEKSSHGTKLYYIAWPNGSIDTLFADYYRSHEKPNPCLCLDPLNELTLNGVPYVEKTNYDVNGIFIWETK